MKNKPISNLLNLKSKNELKKSNTMYYNQGIVISWDNEKANLNIKKHGVSFEEASTSIEQKQYEERV